MLSYRLGTVNDVHLGFVRHFISLLLQILLSQKCKIVIKDTLTLSFLAHINKNLTYHINPEFLEMFFWAESIFDNLKIFPTCASVCSKYCFEWRARDILYNTMYETI